MNLISEYETQFQELAMSAPWDIELPIDWFEKLEQTGEVPLLADDDRRSQRWMTQSHALMWFEESHLPRGAHPLGIYTRDFSKSGASFLAPFQIFHNEKVRIALPKFWMQLHVVRTERVASKCYEIGASVISRHDPSWEAFAISSSAMCESRAASALPPSR